jgi:hypothetical protein
LYKILIMKTIYKLKATELNLDFIEAIKKLFHDEEILLSIVPVKQANSKKLKYSQKLLKSIENIEKGKLKSFSGEEFEKLTLELLNK